MPLGVREVLVAVRARDVASRVLREIGSSWLTASKDTDKYTESQQKMLAAQAATNAALFSTGAKLTGVGVLLGAAGAAGINFFNKTTEAAMEYNRQAALTKTQIDELGVSVNDIADIGRRVAAQVPAPFDQMQTALYDIFSSMEIGVKDAEKLLHLFAVGAVAGQTDIQTAARSTISIMNAYGLPFEDAGHVMDVLFQLVRKGVGTYEEFNQAIGRAIPAAVSAGQEIETLAGIMAFLTRNGLSTEMAATSAARAMELFTKPDITAALESIGVAVTDAQGNFRQLDDIVMDLANSKGWATMGGADRKKLFQEIFGTGTIQARRFYDTAIPGMDQLGGLVDDMSGSQGALLTAYSTMFDTPAMKAQLLQNQYDLLKEEIGRELIPAKLRLMEAIMKVLDWWNNLDSGVKTMIIRFAAIAAVIATVAGVVLTIVGLFLMLAGVIGGISAAAAVVAAVFLGFAAAAAAVYALITGNKALLAVMAVLLGPITLAVIAVKLLVTHFQTLRRVAVNVWHAINIAAREAFGAIQTGASAIWHALQGIWNVITIAAVGAWHAIQAAVKIAVSAIVTAVNGMWLAMQGVWNVISTVAVGVWHALRAAAVAALNAIVGAAQFLWEKLQQFWNWLTGTKVWDDLVEIWNEVIKQAKAVGQEIVETFQSIKDRVTTAISAVVTAAKAVGNFFKTVFVGAFNIVKDELTRTWNAVVAIFRFAFNTIKAVIMAVVDNVIMPLWNKFGDEIIRGTKFAWNIVTEVIKNVFNFISGIVKIGINVISGVIRAGMGFVTSVWNIGWKAVSAAVSIAWNLISNIIEVAINLIAGLIRAVLPTIVAIFEHTWNIILTVITFVWNSIVNVVKTAVTIVGNFIQFILNIIQMDWDEAWQNIVNIATAVWDFISTQIQVVFNAVASFWSSTWNLVKSVFESIWNAILAFIKAITGTFQAVFTAVFNAIAVFWTALWDGIMATITFIWNSIMAFVQGGLALFNTIWTNTWNGVKFLWDTIWNGIHTTLSTIWGLIKGIWNGIISFINDTLAPKFTWLKDRILGAFYAVRDTMKGVWDNIIGKVKDGVNGAIGVANKLLGGIRTVLKAIGLDSIAEKLKDIPKLEFGGIVPVYASGGTLAPFVTNQPRAIVGEGKSAYPEYVIPTDPLYRGRAIGLYESLGAKLFKAGTEGLREPFKTDVETVLRKGHGDVWLSSALRSREQQARLYDLYKKGLGNKAAPPGTSKHELGLAVDYAGNRSLYQRLAHEHNQFFPVPGEPWHAEPTGPSLGELFRGALKLLFGPAKDAAMRLMNGIPIKFVKDISKKVIDLVWNWVVQEDNKLPGDPGSSSFHSKGSGGWNVMRWRNVGLQALALAGSPSHWIGSLLRRMNQESGGNPRAINNWDSNARRGTPSKGLMQVIDPTFRAYAGSLFSRGIWDPLANIYASTRYANARYGQAPIGWNKSGGYAKGAWNILSDQIAPVHRGEMIIPAREASLIRRGALVGGDSERVMFQFNGPVSFGSERTIDDLDWWTRSNNSGV